MPNILEEIVEQTVIDLRKRKQERSFSDLGDLELFERESRDFGEALQLENDVAVIAEIKKASPSKGLIREDFDPQRIAAQYQEGGASAISVLTDEPAFKGSLKYLETASKEVSIPLLRKDFIVEPYQVKEAKAFGADAVLLIATITDGHQLQELLHAAKEFELQALVECYSEEDFEYVNFEHVDILGVNNRDLRTFDVDLHRGVELLHKAPEDTVLVSESGLSSATDLQFLLERNIDAALIGEYFMRQENPGEAVSAMKSELQNLITTETK
ncbi:indole-3-glycerol phosphate synthase TrpC [Fodinibius halophilus]|uniref:Indole-3-glycerol phosphate synthase n=1 Tax=Fodinibius halophilus TaxID=1736908 RepID=A0A6M1T1B1_9BACT|nr:indole-3-glycerol phosphate synthase TrpC [Fodinibius halophilus]NGP86975.1 indole-3-glycerol phosphate synthase TrpC [Fodinibius halophilus]